jgi:tetratricopeptide (TPR) repeat protein
MTNINKIYKALMIGSLSVAITSCDLETINKAALPPEIALADSAGFKSLVGSIYERVNDFNYYGQQAMIEPEIMADNMVIVNRTGRYEGEFVNEIGAHMERWGVDPGAGATLSDGRYVSINEANIVIAKIDNLTDLQLRKARRDELKGEAYFLRALNYFDLHRVYSYEPGKEVDGFNLGVILRTEPVEAASQADFRERSTNVQGYELIEADLKTAIDLLPEPSAAKGYPYRASKLAAKALLAKVYLYWGRYGDAATYADQALAYTNSPLTTTANFIAGFVSGKPHPESFFESDIVASDWNSVDGANNSLNSITMNALGGAQYVVAASDELINAHETDDVRLGLYQNTDATRNRWQSKKWSGSSGSYLENIPIIRRADILLIAAEAKARTSQEDDARTALNALRVARGLTETTADGQGLIDLILNERRVELAFEGNRWFDLKRLGLDIPKPAASTQPTLSYSDFRILGRIPVDQVIQNSLLKQNPDY